MIRLIHQIGPAPIGRTGPYEGWILDSHPQIGRGIRMDKADPPGAWEWVPGPHGGAWVTEDPEVAQRMIDQGIPVVEAQ